ncbi:MAG: 2-C-methyl-D-erythritol 4-phosphate cytidylyltransferase/D-ribitol-5-phosphate cytidylyltransferase [Anaerocolumna sp.]|jgi:2-C-methyl-D-erythritol 4-phosphate cytidylyltransferase|nr:2-C-methyl-D-erythritol 4-phosphate cytidylyltransferase/D-ribitol-5-phosphate cytidylyltransferase [Anaerocolumna sp.]
MSRRCVFGVVLAGGLGSRMGNTDTPKQYMDLGGKPVIIHTIEKFHIHPEIENIVVLCPKAWVKHTENLLKKYISNLDSIHVIEGGDTRNETIMSAIGFIEEKYGLYEDTIIVTHDSVRPFISHRIISDNISCAKKYGACDTVIPSSDTIVRSDDGGYITDIPERKFMYQGQTPQSFKAKMLKEMFLALNEEEKNILTDAAKILVLKGQKVYLIQGEVSNIKITYPFDLRVAQALLGEGL